MTRWTRQRSSACTASPSRHSTGSPRRSENAASTVLSNITPSTPIVNFIKDGVRVDWTCHHIVNGKAYQFPGIELPLSLFERPREIEFIGETFRIPNPPEEYLQSKVRARVANTERARLRGRRRHEDQRRHTAQPGPQTPARRHHGPAAPPQLLALRVFNREGEAVSGADVIVAGIGRTTTDAQGLARFFVPEEIYYAVVVAYPGHREILYEEVLTPGASYTYRPGPIVTPEEHYKAGVRALALVRE